MKPVFLVGKGPSVVPVDLSTDYCVAALNGAIKMCARADYLFVNDWSALGEITMRDLATKVEVLVLPTRLHMTTCGKKTLDVARLQSVLRRKQVLCHRLPSSQSPAEADVDDNGRAPMAFGRQLSVGETAAAFMLHMGHREFHLVGIDPEGQYHESFGGGFQKKTKSRRWYRQNWRRIFDRIKDGGGTVARHVPEGFPVNPDAMAEAKPQLVPEGDRITDWED